MAYNSIYVYGIVDGQIRKEFRALGIGNREDKISCVPFKDVTAIVSYTPFQEYDPTEENTLAHETVIQEILQEGATIAPMRFCTILKSEGDFRKLLHSGYLAFKRNILKIRDKREWGVKVFLDVEKLKAEMSNDEELLEKSRAMAAELQERLNQVAEEAVLEEQLTEDMIINAAFLVHKEKIAEFQEKITAFDRQYTDILKIRISGPTAPYNFVTMPSK